MSETSRTIKLEIDIETEPNGDYRAKIVSPTDDMSDAEKYSMAFVFLHMATATWDNIYEFESVMPLRLISGILDGLHNEVAATLNAAGHIVSQELPAPDGRYMIHLAYTTATHEEGEDGDDRSSSEED
jgi:hypothetical protein